ncbi:MAG TPA: hypothetical protein VN408_13620 [Actinoplanes sp.]|nr:hypothetical protein [Actinoplanes sp.]
MNRKRNVGLAALGALVALSGCGAAEEAVEQPHGYVAGAAEASEAQSAIAYAARGARRLHLLDLATEQEKQVELAVAAGTLGEDGRFVYVSDGDRTLEIVDSGGWTVDHTDHVHYYRAPAKTLGTVVFERPVRTVAGGGAYTTAGTDDGRIRVFDRRQLEEGRITEVATIDSGSATALAVPYGEGLLVAVGDDPDQPASRIVAMDADGRETGTFHTPCQAPRDWVVLRGGVMIDCADSLVRIKQLDGRLAAQAIDSPGSRATTGSQTATGGPALTGGFGYRPRSNEAAVATADGIVSVNAAKATARLVPSGGRDLTTAVSPADSRTALALDTSGTLISFDLESGRKLAEKPLRAATLTLDVSRAYLAEPAAGVIHEIDYADRLRTARTLRTTERPDLLVEVGR